MKNDDSYKLGKHESDIENLRKEGFGLDDRLKLVERYISVQKIATGIKSVTILRCTALWGFIIASATAMGGFVAYNFIKVKAAIIAAYTAFYDGH